MHFQMLKNRTRGRPDFAARYFSEKPPAGRQRNTIFGERLPLPPRRIAAPHGNGRQADV